MKTLKSRLRKILLSLIGLHTEEIYIVKDGKSSTREVVLVSFAL